MAKKQARDRAYYEDRLKHESPKIYADLQAGKHRTITEAAIAAGLKKSRTRLLELKNAFRKASKAEQTAFLGWLAAQGYSISPSSAAGTAALTIAVDGKLLPAAAKRIEEIIMKRQLKVGDVMAEMGFRRLNASLGRALHRGDRLKPDVITALEKWLAANASI
ncbi:hypothetical protein I7I49_00975 [Sinorhizobium meliloti]|uniref:hypothetical protein n=1 Tax=Rhizobium meliloti TaxID=382 RepID=UPI00237F4A30|nr:hypothetical protein [Sinorhizobium meliloti]MDE3808853.1 hypothetical protein [Sinorhizobium meliloti]